MYIIVGLGNPTRQYEGTKHNVGFDTIDYLIDEYQIPSSGTGHKALFGKGMIAGQKVIVAKPMTYMNLSGESVRELVNYYKVDPESELIVVYDDINWRRDRSVSAKKEARAATMASKTSSLILAPTILCV